MDFQKIQISIVGSWFFFVRKTGWQAAETGWQVIHPSWIWFYRPDFAHEDAPSLLFI